MKKIILFLLALCFTTQIYADSFVMIKVDNQQHLQQIFNRQDINVHYCNDNFVLATTKVLSDDWTVVSLDGKLSAHYEHTVLITENGYEILSKL